VVISTKYEVQHSSADCGDGSIPVVEQTDTIHVALAGATVGPAHSV
jgi:hypothetical protein